MTVSKTENGWNGDFLRLFLDIASVKKEWSKWALCPIKIALEQPFAVLSVLIILKSSSSASFSVIAFLNGWLRLIFVKSNDSCSTTSPSKGSIWYL